MNTDSPPQYVEHMPTLPCQVCHAPARMSRIEPRENERWIMIPLCSRHRPDQPDGETLHPDAAG
jgi:hypothetical protein